MGTGFADAHTLCSMTVPMCRLVVEEGFGFLVVNAGDEYHIHEKENG
jgi:hypothetical protein